MIVIRKHDSKIHQAVFENDLEKLRSHMRRPLEFRHEPNDDGISPLYVAAANGHTDACRVLLEHGAVIDMEEAGRTPLHAAASNGHAEICALLVDWVRDRMSTAQEREEGLYVDLPLLKWKNGTLRTPLQEAALNGRADVCEVLLERGAQHAPSEAGRTPLSFAAQEGHLDVCALLLDRGATHEHDSSHFTPLHHAARRGHADVCGLLLKRGADPQALTYGGYTALYHAAHRGHVDVCATLLDHGVPMQSRSERASPLYAAAESGHLDTCAFLLDRGATHTPCYSEGDTPLHVAASRGYLDICTLLLDRGATHARCSKWGTTPLYAAARSGFADVCALLLDRGATHAACKHGTTPLYVAAERGLADVCALLLDRGATHASETFGGCTPLHAAARRGHVDVVNLLIARGADIDAQNKAGCTPLLMAAARSEDRVIRDLLERGAQLVADSRTQQLIKKLFDNMHPSTRAILAQRAPEIFKGVSKRACFSEVGSVADLVFAVHTAYPRKTRRHAINFVCTEVLKSRRRPQTIYRIEVLDVLAMFTTHSREFILQAPNLSVEEKEAFERGLLIRRVWGHSRKGLTAQQPVISPRLPWWTWTRILVATYGIPDSWTGDAFWRLPSGPLNCVFGKATAPRNLGE